MKRHTLTVLTILVLGVATGRAATAAALNETPADREFNFAFTPSSATPGGTVTFTGKCLYLGSPAGLTFDVHLSGHSTPDGGHFGFGRDYDLGPDGTVGGTFTIPADAPPDTDYYLGGICAEGDAVIDTGQGPFTVLPLPTTTAAATTSPVPPPTSGLVVTTVRSAAGSTSIPASRQPSGLLADTGVDISRLALLAGLLLAAGVLSRHGNRRTRAVGMSPTHATGDPYPSTSETPPAVDG